MLASKNCVAIIPARKGSKGLPLKNKMLLNGKPLIAYTLEAAINSQAVDILVSTDDEDIVGICKGYGISMDYIRPEQISGDNTPMIDVVKHALTYIRGNIGIHHTSAMILQPTSPFRTGIDIARALELKKENPNKSVVGVSKMLHHPSECLIEGVNTKEISSWEYLVPPSAARRRQDYIGEYWFINGAMYCHSIEKILNQTDLSIDDACLFKMDLINSIDIDSQFEFTLCEAIAKSNYFKNLE